MALHTSHGPLQERLLWTVSGKQSSTSEHDREMKIQRIGLFWTVQLVLIVLQPRDMHEFSMTCTALAPSIPCAGDAWQRIQKGGDSTSLSIRYSSFVGQRLLYCIDSKDGKSAATSLCVVGQAKPNNMDT
jgi:hypothetical protein